MQRVDQDGDRVGELLGGQERDSESDEFEDYVEDASVQHADTNPDIRAGNNPEQGAESSAGEAGEIARGWRARRSGTVWAGRRRCS